MGQFTTIFAHKTDNFDFQVSTLQCHQNPKKSVVQIDLSIGNKEEWLGSPANMKGANKDAKI